MGSDPETSTDQSPEHEILREKLATALEHLPAERELNVRALEELLPHFNTFDLIAWVSLRNLSIDPENYHEGEGGGMAVRVEHLTLLCLINGFEAGKALTPLDETYERVSGLVDDVCTSALLEPVQRQLESADGPMSPWNCLPITRE